MIPLFGHCLDCILILDHGCHNSYLSRSRSRVRMRRCSWPPVSSFLARMRMKSLRLNKELFYSSSHNVFQVALETLEGHQRAIMGSMTVEEIYRDRKKFSKAVFEVASSDLGEEPGTWYKK